MLPDLLRRVFAHTLERIDLGSRVREPLGTGLLKTGFSKTGLLQGRERSRILAVGKAAPAMLAGALDKTVRSVLLIVPEGTPLAYVDPRTEVVFSDHPLPTKRSVRAAERAFAFARGGPMLVLLSGGTSSLLCAPIDGLDLDAKRDLTLKLLRSGAPVGDINVVRRHVSRIKGGGLGRACTGAVLTLIACDVLKGAPHDVGSGPTVPDPTTTADARVVLERLRFEAPLAETLKSADPEAARLEQMIIASPADLVEAAQSSLEDEGIRVYTLPPTDRDVGELAAAYQGLAQTLSPGEALIRVAEPTVRVAAREPGAGGRSTHLAAMLSTRIPRDCAVLCGASDGIDGTSGAAGAIAWGPAMRGLDVRSAIGQFATADLHRTAGTLLETRGPTGLNLCDLHVIARAPR